jgi:hypothetical protein
MQVQAAARSIAALPPTKTAARFVVADKDGGFEGSQGKGKKDLQARICEAFAGLKVDDAEICAAISADANHEIHHQNNCNGQVASGVADTYDYSHAVIGLVVDNNSNKVTHC